MALWNVSVRLGAEIGGADSECVRSKLGPDARMPEAGYGDPPDYKARGVTLLRLEANTEEQAGSIALARVHAAAAECNLHIEPELRSVSPMLIRSAVAPPHHGRRAAAVKDPGSIFVAEAIQKRRRVGK